jgi:hypothetical protein
MRIGKAAEAGRVARAVRAAAAPLALAAALGLAACNPFAPLSPTREDIVRDRIAGPELAEAPGTIYCYRTLAKVDCRAVPEPGQEDRLMSHDGGNLAGPAR